LKKLNWPKLGARPLYKTTAVHTLAFNS